MKKSDSKYTSDLFLRINPDKQQRILKTAVEEFARNGYPNANVNSIAKNAGISIGSLYKYFATKDDLFMYIVHEASLLIQENIKGIIESDDPVLTKIEKLLYTAHGYSLEEPDLIKLYDVFTSDNDEKRATVTAERLEGITSAAYRKLISDAQKSGEVRDDVDPGVLAMMIDNQLMVTQFSFANEYYNKRLRLYLDAEPVDGAGDDDSDDSIDVDAMIKEIMTALERMLSPDNAK